MSGPRTVGGRKRQGWRGEAVVKGYYLAMGYQVFDLSPNLTGADLLVLSGGRVFCVVEVKTTPWRDLPSPVRQTVARAGDTYRAQGYLHRLWAPDGARGAWETREVGVVAGKASTLSGPAQTDLAFAVGRSPRGTDHPPTGAETPAVACNRFGGRAHTCDTACGGEEE